MKPSPASAWTKSLIVRAMVSGAPMNDWRPVTSMTTSRADRLPASARARHSLASATGSLANCRTLARPLDDQGVADHRVEVRQRPVDVEVRQLACSTAAR